MKRLKHENNAPLIGGIVPDCAIFTRFICSHLSKQVLVQIETLTAFFFYLTVLKTLLYCLVRMRQLAD